MIRKRFTSEAEILAAIDQCHAISNAKLLEVELLEQQIVEARKSEDSFTIQQLRIKQDQLRVGATNLIDKKAKKLDEKLSQFRTPLMPFTGKDAKALRVKDRSVVR